MVVKEIKERAGAWTTKNARRQKLRLIKPRFVAMKLFETPEACGP